MPPPEIPALTSIEEIGRLLLKTCLAYGKAYKKGMADVYQEDLADLTPQEVELAFKEARRRCKFFPNPAELREALYAAIERAPRQSRRESDPNCTECRGEGWKTTEKDGRRFVVTCPCRQRKAV